MRREFIGCIMVTEACLTTTTRERHRDLLEQVTVALAGDIPFMPHFDL